MAAPAPEAEADPAPPAPAPAPPLPPPLSQERYLTVTAVACSTCYRVLSATFNGQENRTRFACGSDEHSYQRDVPNPAPDKYLVHELKNAPQDPRHAVLLIACPNRNITQCEGTRCTLYKISDGNGKKEFLVCHTCKKYWRAT